MVTTYKGSLTLSKHDLKHVSKALFLSLSAYLTETFLMGILWIPGTGAPLNRISGERDVCELNMAQRSCTGAG